MADAKRVAAAETAIALAKRVDTLIIVAHRLPPLHAYPVRDQ
jgi:hypothetical protein